MDDEDLEMYVKGVLHRNPELKLTTEQAAKLVALEQEAFPLLVGGGFSPWEQWDYELDRVGGFLDDEQYKLYEQKIAERSLAHDKRLKEEDERESKELLLREEYNVWLRDMYLPKLKGEAFRVPIIFRWQLEKVAYLRMEYKRYMQERRHKALIQHYRHSRRLQPNKLRIAMLLVEQTERFPSYESFMRESDEVVRAVGTFLVDQFRAMAENATKFIGSASEENDLKWKELRTKYHGESEIRGWHTIMTPRYDNSPEIGFVMSMMLMDPTYNEY